MTVDGFKKKAPITLGKTLNDCFINDAHAQNFLFKRKRVPFSGFPTV